jgi:type IV fimbrial biogenesis protein FimT
MKKRMAAVDAKAFSLTELMTALSIVSILLGIGLPGVRTIMQRQRMTTTVNDLFAALRQTRSEAVQHGRRVDLVPADGKDWANGWVVYVDENDNHRPDAGDHVLLVHDAVPGGISITASLTDSSVPYIAYDASGRTRTNASSQSPQAGTLSFSQEGTVKRRIKIGFLGRPRVCDPAADSTCTGTGDTK